MTELSSEIRQHLLAAQLNEITEHHIYARIAARQPDSENRRILQHISDDELRHYKLWKHYTGQDVEPKWGKVRWYTFISRLLGFTFALKLMENGEVGAQENYATIAREIPDAEQIRADEDQHENELLGMLDEESLHYAGSIVLGLNDALVELTGALAGYTLAFSDVKIVALSGLITGVAAALSMAASEFLSTSSEQTDKNPLQASTYTGIAYIITVALLILPYLLLANKFICLAITLTTAVLVIALFNYYISVARSEPFRKRFLTMSGISLGVAAFSFGMGYLIRIWLGVNV